MKKIFTFLLAILLVFACLLQFPITAEAASTVDSDVYNGITWKVTSNRTLTLSGNGPIEILEADRYNWDYPWKDYQRYITKVVIKKGVTAIGDCAFAGYANLKSVTIPNTVERIGTEAFIYCGSLKKLSVPSSVTQMGERIFNETPFEDSLKSVGGVIYVGKVAYKGTRSSGKLTIRKGTVGVATHAFADCRGVTSLSIPSSVRYIASGNGDLKTATRKYNA